MRKDTEISPKGFLKARVDEREFLELDMTLTGKPVTYSVSGGEARWLRDFLQSAYPEQEVIKPPLGVKPRHLWLWDRMLDLLSYLTRQMTSESFDPQRMQEAIDEFYRTYQSYKHELEDRGRQ